MFLVQSMCFYCTIHAFILGAQDEYSLEDALEDLKSPIHLSTCFCEETHMNMKRTFKTTQRAT